MERWAMGKGLAALLVTLSPQFDHLLQGGKRADFTPANKTTEEITRAYRKAMLLLHPDRQSQSSDSNTATEQARGLVAPLGGCHEERHDAASLGLAHQGVRKGHRRVPGVAAAPTRWPAAELGWDMRP